MKFYDWRNKEDKTMRNKLQNKVHELAEQPYTIKVEKDKTVDGQEVFLAFHPELIGCMAQGGDVKEAVDNLKEVTEEYILSLLEDGLPIPAPATKLTSTVQETVNIIGTFTAPATETLADIFGKVVRPSTREEVATVELITC
jgi:predicted RNase H-like HicB family nuclease